MNLILVMRADFSISHFPCGEGQGLLDLGKVQKEFAGGKGPLWAERAGARESLGNGGPKQLKRFELSRAARNHSRHPTRHASRFTLHSPSFCPHFSAMSFRSTSYFIFHPCRLHCG
jgi:hypothetical protein